MIPSQALILCAGLGTRLGKISSIVPKAMLPLFDKRLVDYQIEYLYQSGIKEIIVNSHHLSEVLEKHISQNYKNINIVREEALLGSGGAFHNLKRLGVKGKILAINVDTLYFFERNLEDVFQSIEEHQLIGLQCEKDATYNRLVLDNLGQLMAIVAPQETDSAITFSGMSLINLELLSYVEGVSHFFSSVCVPAGRKTRVIRDIGPHEFYDLGTIKEYASSYKKLTTVIDSNQGLWRKYFPFWARMIGEPRPDMITLQLTQEHLEKLDLIKSELVHSPA